MASGITKSPWVKDAVVKPSSGAPDLEFEGPAKFAAPEFNIGDSKKLVVSVGDGDITFGKDSID